MRASRSNQSSPIIVVDSKTGKPHVLSSKPKRKIPIWVGIVSFLIVIGLPVVAIILMSVGAFGFFN